MSVPIKIKNLTKAYGSKVILKNISFDVNPSEFIVLVGPSGCGKSTMLRTIAGLEEISSGQIIIDDTNVSDLKPKDRDIAMVFQDYALYPHKNVFENIAFGLRVRKLPEDEIQRKVKEAATKLELTDFLNRKPAALSGGQRQRVAIGRALVRNPKVFLFDEPLSNLDAKLRGAMRQTISRLHKEHGITTVYVTHDQIEAMTLADKIIVLDGGKIQQMGSPLDLYYHPINTFVATFIGSPSMNLLEGELTDVAGELKFTSDFGVEYIIPEKYHIEIKENHKSDSKVYWGIRPENFRLAIDGKKTEYKAKVIVSELLGPVTSVLCDLNGHEINISLEDPHRPLYGDELEFCFESKHLYLFDKSSGLALVK